MPVSRPVADDLRLAAGMDRLIGSRRLTVSADTRAIAWTIPDHSADSQHSHEDIEDGASLDVPAQPTASQTQALQLPTWQKRQQLK